jgi:hypothetical protein
MIAAGRSDQTALALEYFGRPNNWYDMWTAYEIIETEIFRSTPKRLRPKGDGAKRKLLRSRNWVPKDDLRRFAESCNHHRHGAKKPPTSEENANTDQAHHILSKILQGWLEESGKLFMSSGHASRLGFS